MRRSGLLCCESVDKFCRVTKVKVRKDHKSIEFTFKGEETPVKFSSEYLRVMDPSAERVSHVGQETLVYGKRHVTIATVMPVGNYALRIGFSDGHTKGIYSWGYIKVLHEQRYSTMRKYIEDLQNENQTRDPAGSTLSISDKVRANMEAKKNEPTEEGSCPSVSGASSPSSSPSPFLGAAGVKKIPKVKSTLKTRNKSTATKTAKKGFFSGWFG